MNRLFATFPVAIILMGSSLSGHANGDPSRDPPRLSPAYGYAETFLEFRDMLIAEGWKPKENPGCLNEVIGGDYEETCRADPEKSRCHVCKMLPEIDVSTASGHTFLGYTKEGVGLSVELYGDLSDFDKPPPHDLAIMGWFYD